MAGRLKTYSAGSGYVYQYLHVDQRAARYGKSTGAEYLFDVSADRKTFFSVSVFVQDSAMEAWECEHGRSLAANERYAIAKMALFQAFDERQNPARMRERIVVRPADAEAILVTLGLD